MKEFNYRGGTYSLYFNGLLLFAFYERYGSEANPMDVIEPMTREGFEATIWMLCEMSRQGDLYRRFLGGEPGQVLEYSRTLAAVQPTEFPEIKAAVIETIANGFRREHTRPEDNDPWLQEFEAERNPKKARPGRNIFACLRRAFASLFKRG